MPSGTVKWFNNAKGYGFILPDEGSEDLFAHYSSIMMEGYKTLKAGQIVHFDIVQGGKGFHATNISSPESESPPAAADPNVGEPAQSAERSAESTVSSATSDSELETIS